MLAVFDRTVAKSPEGLRSEGGENGGGAASLVNHFSSVKDGAVTISLGSCGSLAYSAENQNPLLPRLFAAVDDIFCLFQGHIGNIPLLKQQYGLSKTANEVIIVIEAYRTLRDRGPYPADQVVRDLNGKFAFILFDSSSKTTFIAAADVVKFPSCSTATATALSSVSTVAASTVNPAGILNEGVIQDKSLHAEIFIDESVEISELSDRGAKPLSSYGVEDNHGKQFVANTSRGDTDTADIIDDIGNDIGEDSDILHELNFPLVQDNPEWLSLKEKSKATKKSSIKNIVEQSKVPSSGPKRTTRFTRAKSTGV